MNRFEDELRNALRRESPPPGFAARVVARAAGAKRPWGLARWFGARGVRWAVAAVLALVLLGAGFEYQREREERARGEAVRAQVLLALRITSAKLQFAQQKIQELQVPTKSREIAQ